MSISLKFKLIRLGVLVAGCSLLAKLMEAQSVAVNAPTNSRVLFGSGDYGNAEALLFADNVSPLNTGAWYLESGTKLMYLATSFSNRHDPVSARAAAKEAIAKLQTAETRLVTEQKLITAARANELVGTLCEFVLHDPVAAAAAYHQALLHDPNATGAKNATARLAGLPKG